MPHDPEQLMVSRAIANREIVEKEDTEAPDELQIIRDMDRAG